MAIRRASQKAQVIKKLAEVAPAGETFEACVHCETGPSPWLNAVFDQIPFLGLIVGFSRKFFFLTLTNTSIVVNSANRFTNRPGEVVGSFARDQFPLVRVNRGVWSTLWVQFPGQGKPTRLNVSRYWRSELDQLLTAAPHVPVEGKPAA